jgi:ABC-type transport system substrate-binding protein
MKRTISVLVSVFILASMLLAACGTPATEAPAAPAATEAPAAPAATEAPAAPAAPAFVGEKLAAADCTYGGNIKAIEAIDESTVKFSFCAPEPAFLPKVASVEAFDIYDAEYLKLIGNDANKMNAAPVGTGPYVVKEWVRGDHITLEANPTYFGEKPANSTFIFKWSSEAAARLLDLQAGNVSGIAEVTSDDIPTISADANLKLYPRKINNFLYLGINNTRAPFDNEQVRQALAMAINKQQIVDDFYVVGSVPATQFVPKGVKPGYSDGYSSPAYDPAKAKEMLTAAGFDFTKEYTLAYAFRTRPYFPQPAKIAQAVQAQLAEIGVNIKLSEEEWATYLPSVRNGEKDLFFLGWSEDYPDATNWYDVFLMGTNDSFGKPWADIQDPISKAGKMSDPAARQALYDEVNKLVDQHVPMITVANGTTSLAFLSNVENVVIGPYNENFSQMKTADGTLVFSQDGEPVSLLCSDETDGSSFRVCNQIFSKLYTFEFGSATLKPDLAEKCEGNADATEWTCTLKKGVVFSNGATFDANDVVATFAAALDYTNPLHKGNKGDFQYFKDLLGPKLINEPAQ